MADFAVAQKVSERVEKTGKRTEMEVGDKCQLWFGGTDIGQWCVGRINDDEVWFENKDAGMLVQRSDLRFGIIVIEVYSLQQSYNKS